MIIVINSQGGLVSIQDEDLFQGSTKLNVINLVAPFADNIVWKANFEMPDGTYEPEDLDGYLFTPSVKIVDNLNVWKLLVTFPITQDYGIVTMQLRGYIGDVVVCSTSIKFPIQKGVPYSSNFEELSDKDQLIQLINDLKALLNNKVDKINYNYKRAEYVNQDSVGIYYIYDSETDNYKTVTLPQDYELNTEYYEILNFSRIVNGDNELYLEYVDNSSNQSVKLKLEKDKVTINGKQVVVFDDLKASNIIFDNNISGIESNNVQQAIDNLRASIEEANISSVTDLGDFTITSEDWELVDDLYQYRFTNQLLTNALIQSIIITPDNTAINNLNKEDILVYPEVDIIQESDNIAVAIMKVIKKPTFDMIVNVKLQGHKVNATKGVPASIITFNSTENIPSDNVQSAIVDVQNNLDTFKNTYNIDKQKFVKLDENNKVPLNQLPSTVTKVDTLWEGNFNSKGEVLSLNLAESIKSGDILEFLIQINNGNYKPLIVRAGNVGSVVTLTDFSINNNICYLGQVGFLINTDSQLQFTGGNGLQITTTGTINSHESNCILVKISKVVQ